jgi:hypothetical protein
MTDPVRPVAAAVQEPPCQFAARPPPLKTGYSSLVVLRHSALPTTLTDDSAIAAAATSGESMRNGTNSLDPVAVLASRDRTAREGSDCNSTDLSASSSERSISDEDGPCRIMRVQGVVRVAISRATAVLSGRIVTGSAALIF